jgi:hypothetical protein
MISKKRFIYASALFMLFPTFMYASPYAHILLHNRFPCSHILLYTLTAN